MTRCPILPAPVAPIDLTRKAQAAAVWSCRRGTGDRVLRRELVPPFAVGLLTVVVSQPTRRDPGRSPVVHARRDGLQVGGVVAVPDPAQMVDLETVRDRANPQLMSDDMDVPEPGMPVLGDADADVTVRTNSPIPQPARIALPRNRWVDHHMRHKTFGKISHVPTLAGG